MAYYVILDSNASLVESFDQEDEARATLEEIVRQDPHNGDEYAMVQYDNSGHPVGQALVGSELGVHA